MRVYLACHVWHLYTRQCVAVASHPIPRLCDHVVYLSSHTFYSRGDKLTVYGEGGCTRNSAPELSIYFQLFMTLASYV